MTIEEISSYNTQRNFQPEHPNYLQQVIRQSDGRKDIMTTKALSNSARDGWIKWDGKKVIVPDPSKVMEKEVAAQAKEIEDLRAQLSAKNKLDDEVEEEEEVVEVEPTDGIGTLTNEPTAETIAPKKIGRPKGSKNKANAGNS